MNGKVDEQRAPNLRKLYLVENTPQALLNETRTSQRVLTVGMLKLKMSAFYVKVFWCGQFLESIEFVALLLFPMFWFWLRGMWDLSSPTTDWTHTPCIEEVLTTGLGSLNKHFIFKGRVCSRRFVRKALQLILFQFNILLVHLCTETEDHYWFIFVWWLGSKVGR